MCSTHVHVHVYILYNLNNVYIHVQYIIWYTQLIDFYKPQCN